VAEWCRQLEARLRGKTVPYNRAAAIGLLRQLCARAARETPDYDMARQRAWAFRMIYADLEPKPANASEVQDRWKGLNEELQLALPAGQEHQILVELPASLRKRSEYHPAKVQQVFQELARLLPPK
jgi:hypothetical protein